MARMGRLDRTTLIGACLIALAVANLSLMDGLGSTLVERVYRKYDELGSGWVLLESKAFAPDARPFAPAEVAARLGTVEGVRETLPFWQTTHVQVKNASRNLNLLMLGPGYDLQAHPYLFLSFGSATEGTAFLRNELRLHAGRFPSAPGEMAVEKGHADAEGIVVGERHELRNDLFGEGVSLGERVVTGVFSRQKVGDVAEGTPFVVTAHEPGLAARFEERSFAVGFPALYVAARVDLREIPETIGRMRARLAEGGIEPRMADPSWEAAPEGSFGEAPTDLMLYTNADLMESAAAASARSGWWFRVLGASALALATLGTAFVAAAAEAARSREVGIRQALGFSAFRLHAAALRSTVLVGSAAGAAGALLALVLTASGADVAALGTDLSVDAARLFLFGVPAGVAVHGVSLLPLHWRLASRTPSENLRRAWR